MVDPYVVPFQPGPKAFEVLWREGLTYPFFEDEDANGVYGYGHQDKETFANLVNEYDADCRGDFAVFAEAYTEDFVIHAYAEALMREEREEDDWRFTVVLEPSEASVPITYISR